MIRLIEYLWFEVRMLRLLHATEIGRNTHFSKLFRGMRDDVRKGFDVLVQFEAQDTDGDIPAFRMHVTKARSGRRLGSYRTEGMA